MSRYSVERGYPPRVIVDEEDVRRIFFFLSKQYHSIKDERLKENIKEDHKYIHDQPPFLRSEFSDGTKYVLDSMADFFNIKTTHRKVITYVVMSFRYDKSEMTVELKDSYFGAGLVKIEGSEHRVREALDYINQILVPSTDFSSRFRNIKTEFLYVIISFIVILTSFALCILNRPIDSLDVFILAIIGVLSLVPLGLIDDLRDRWATKIVFNWGEGEKIYKRGIRNVRFMIFILPLWVISTVIIPILLK